MWMNCFWTYICVPCVSFSWRPKDGVRSSRTRVTPGYELWCRCLELNLGPLEEKLRFLNTEPSFLPWNFILITEKYPPSLPLCVWERFSLSMHILIPTALISVIISISIQIFLWYTNFISFEYILEARQLVHPVHLWVFLKVSSISDGSPQWPP